MDIIQTESFVGERFPFIKVEFDLQGKILSSNTHCESNDFVKLQEAVPNNLDSIISSLFERTNDQLNAISKSDTTFGVYCKEHEKIEVRRIICQIIKSKKK